MDEGVRYFSQDIGGWGPGVYEIKHNLDSDHVVVNHGGILNIDLKDRNTMILRLRTTPPEGEKVVVVG